MNNEVAEWLELKRKIPVEIATRFGTTVVNGKPAFEFREIDGSLAYHKIRIDLPNGEKSFARDRKNVKSVMFLENLLAPGEVDPNSPLVVTEGELDAIACRYAGVPNAGSVPDGAQLAQLGQGAINPLDDRSFGWMWDERGELKAHFARFNRIILAVDDDPKGRILREELAVRFGRWKCYSVRFPAGIKDANELLIERGPDALRDCIDQAVPLEDDQLEPLGISNETDNRSFWEIGLKGFDMDSGGLGIALTAPSLVVFSGTPGSGKSEFSQFVLAQLANRHNVPGALIQLEDNPIRMTETMLSYAMANVEGVATRDQAREWASRWFVRVRRSSSSDQDLDLAWLRRVLREARVRHGAKVVCIDPWNEIEHVFGREKTEAQYTNEALRELKKLAREFGLCVVVCVHPSKEGGRITDITQIDGYSIAGSAAWNNKADHLFVLHRPDHARPDVYVRVVKSKDHSRMGKPGIVRVQYRHTAARYVYVGMGV